ncbi:MAG: hypothetical protein ACRENG_02090 [bacterium]
MWQDRRSARLPHRRFSLVGFALAGGLILAWPALAQALFQQPMAAEPLDVNPFLNMLAMALVIERLLEIGVTYFPGLEEKKAALKDQPEALAQLKLKIMRLTMLIGMAMGVAACALWKFGVLDEIFNNNISPENFFNYLVTGIIAGAGADPVHQMVLILVSLRERLRG